jgi:hypothetical protein
LQTKSKSQLWKQRIFQEGDLKSRVGKKNKKFFRNTEKTELCTNRKQIVNKMCLTADIMAGYTKFFLNFLHNVQRKELAIIGIVL